MALTIRPTEQMNTQIDKIKKAFNLKSSSKVIEKTINDYIKMHLEIDKLNVKLYNKENELNKIKDTILKKDKADENYQKLIKQIKFNKKHDLIYDYDFRNNRLP